MVPKFEYEARPPVLPVAATTIVPAQLAGLLLLAFCASLPAATTTTVLRERALLIAFWVVVSQAPLPPSDMLITCARAAIAGTPETVPPDAQIMPSAMSEV